MNQCPSLLVVTFMKQMFWLSILFKILSYTNLCKLHIRLFIQMQCPIKTLEFWDCTLTPECTLCSWLITHQILAWSTAVHGFSRCYPSDPKLFKKQKRKMERLWTTSWEPDAIVGSNTWRTFRSWLKSRIHSPSLNISLQWTATSLGCLLYKDRQGSDLETFVGSFIE